MKKGIDSLTNNKLLNHAVVFISLLFIAIYGKDTVALTLNEEILSIPIETLAASKDLHQIAYPLYKTHCESCHIKSGKGKKGVTDLTDQLWQWGGSLIDIKMSIENGRTGMMPNFKQDLSDHDIDNVAKHIISRAI